MNRTHWLSAAAASLLMIGACSVSNQSDNGSGNAAAGETGGAVDKLANVEMPADTSYLTQEEREVVNLLMQAADLMNPIYLRQASANNPQLREEIAAKNDPALLAKFDQMMGPWDELDEDKPFFGNAPRPAGAGFYPADLTKEQFDQYLAAHPDEAEQLTSPYTVVKRQGDRLVAVP